MLTRSTLSDFVFAVTREHDQNICNTIFDKTRSLNRKILLQFPDIIDFLNSTFYLFLCVLINCEILSMQGKITWGRFFDYWHSYNFENFYYFIQLWNLMQFLLSMFLAYFCCYKQKYSPFAWFNAKVWSIFIVFFKFK